MRCDCCSTDRAIRSYKTGGRYLAHLCRRCAAAGHALQHCLLCGGRVMTCQFLRHFVGQHPLMLEKLSNMPQAEFEPPPSPQRHLGTLRFGPRGEGLLD